MSLYGEKYAKHLDGLVARIGGRRELAAIQKMISRPRVLEILDALFQYSPRSTPDFSIKVVYPSGKSELRPMYKAPAILEIGFNTGYFLKQMAINASTTQSERFVGIDVNHAAIEEANAKAVDAFLMQKDNAHVVSFGAAYGEMQVLEFDDATFNLVLARHVLEHVPDPAKGLEEAIRVAEPGGLIALTYPFEPVRGLTALLSAIAATGNPFLARKMHLHTLTPGKVARMTDPNYIHSDLSGLKFVPMPVWVHILIRNAKPYNSADYTPFFRRSFAAN